MNSLMLSRASGKGDRSTDLQVLDQTFATIAFASDGTISRVNENYLSLFGYQGDDLVGCHYDLFVPRHVVSGEAYGAFWAGLNRGEIQTSDYCRLRKDGSEIWVRMTSTPVLASDGTIAEIVSFCTDITEQKLRDSDDRGQIAAINTSLAVIHFDLDGTILDANELFLRTMGYRLDEVAGRHHRMFVEPCRIAEAEYASFWRDLAAGMHKAAEYKRIGKDGREVWLQATYNPILDMNGRTFKIVKYATDVTQERLRQADYAGQVAAIHKSHGVITFDMNGIILDANDRLLDAMGYRLHEVRGRHHRMFVESSYAHGPEYSSFWTDLAEGRPQAAEYKRIGKDGREVWLQATYNPVLDPNGRPFKVVKYATVVTREKLRQADLQGQIASIHKAQCVISFAVDGTILDANDNFLDVTGYTLVEVIGKHHQIFVDDTTAASPGYATFWTGLSQGHYQAAEYKRVCKDGREIWLQATYNPILDMNGRTFKIVKYATDVTQERLRQADHEGQITAIQKSQCVVTFAMDGTVLDANDNFLETFGYRLDEIVGRHNRIFVEAGFDETQDYIALWDALRGGSFMSAKFKIIGKGGQEVWIQGSYNPVLDLNGRPSKIIKIATDISADVAIASKFSDVKQQAEHDATTALPNRIRLAAFMTSALAQPSMRLAILYLDLDHFKPINDTFGHHVGDHVLCETADRLRRALAPEQLVARIGGDEFVVAAPNLSDDAIERLCQRLDAIVTAPIHHGKHTLAVGLSIGVSISPGDGRTAEELLRCADVALYRSKGRGRGSYSFFASDIDERMTITRALAEDMRHGIKAGQFFLEYQPRFNARTKMMQSVEALVRWAHPERGRIEPADFLPIAEQNGLIVPLGAWVLRTACDAVKAWPGIGVSVNVSSVQFRETDLTETIDAVLSDTKLSADRLELEITEETLLDDGARTHEVLQALKARGVRLALDDFGTGQASLTHLRAFPFDTIKMDRRLMREIEGKPGGDAIVQAVLGLGKALGMGVTAKGVETAGQLLRLNLDDGNEVQGFLLAQPMSVDGVAALLARDAVLATAAE